MKFLEREGSVRRQLLLGLAAQMSNERSDFVSGTGRFDYGVLIMLLLLL